VTKGPAGRCSEKLPQLGYGHTWHDKPKIPRVSGRDGVEELYQAGQGEERDVYCGTVGKNVWTRV